MVTPEAIQSYIETGMPCDFIRVEGDGHHFEAIIVSTAFDGLNRIKQHQLVYGVLGDRMREEIHALSMKTYSPNEWQQVNTQA
jgi:acid stress-induced BolA-like protein IbaG/YrbA